MKYILRNIKISLTLLTPENEVSLIKSFSSKKPGIPEADIQNLRIIKESVDARKKQEMALVYSILISCDIFYIRQSPVWVRMCSAMW